VALAAYARSHSYLIFVKQGVLVGEGCHRTRKSLDRRVVGLSPIALLDRNPGICAIARSWKVIQ